MTIDETIINEISKYIYLNKNLIPIIDTVEINEFIFGRFDILLNKYYGSYDNRMDLYPLLLDFNSISDPTYIYLGMFINIPDFESFINQLEFSNDSIIPGVNNTTNSKIINRMEAEAAKDSDSTLAVPKLGIRGKKVSYNPETGIIKF